ncbi:type II secretion system minor pseudopilin GspI [Thioflexithrix psekupsensis]|uniref:Type II secretion system protein I n=1 Tax=Thioflexithrix psekupsensis TaxID=1570016 RepID=A0A251X8A7_9GAMM|nr:type II secretion system minor pseudopilin GspI [Thioflexithrix psekupsensis]OUD14289.1 type II secretion system protein GspI [Thioflexithrix psekupsensis]
MTLSSPPKNGFTLLEVLVALAVVAIALAAVIKALGQQVENQRYLQDRTLGQWVAHNVLTELQVKNEWVAVGEKEGNTDMAQRSWFWRIEVSNTIDPRLRRVVVSVYQEPEHRHVIASLVGFLGENTQK